jgi:hypothetical protein
MTKGSAEEKIVQIGRKKMALDKALIDSMDTKDDEGVDVEAILGHGAAALFNDDNQDDIHYNSASVDKLLDRSQLENTRTGKDKTSDSQFSFARIWANDEDDLSEEIGDADSKPAPLDKTAWENLLKQRDVDAAAEAAKNVQDLGRGKRVRGKVDYARGTPAAPGDDIGEDATPHKKGKKRRSRDDSESDTDYANARDTEAENESEGEPVDPLELQLQSQQQRSRSKIISNQQGTKGKIPIKSLQSPQNLAPKPKGSVIKSGTRIILKHSAGSVKLQKGVQKSISVAKKPVMSGESQPNMGTALKLKTLTTQLISKNAASSSKRQPAQSSGRPAMLNDSNKAPITAPKKPNANTLGKTQKAQINGLSANSNGAKKVQASIARPIGPSNYGKKQSAQISGPPAIQNASSKAQAVLTTPKGGSESNFVFAMTGSKTPIDSSTAEQSGSVNDLSQLQSKIENSLKDNDSSKASTQRTTNTMSLQNHRAAMPPLPPLIPPESACTRMGLPPRQELCPETSSKNIKTGYSQILTKTNTHISQNGATRLIPRQDSSSHNLKLMKFTNEEVLQNTSASPRETRQAPLQDSDSHRPTSRNANLAQYTIATPRNTSQIPPDSNPYQPCTQTPQTTTTIPQVPSPPLSINIGPPFTTVSSSRPQFSMLQDVHLELQRPMKRQCKGMVFSLMDMVVAELRRPRKAPKTTSPATEPRFMMEETATDATSHI